MLSSAHVSHGSAEARAARGLAIDGAVMSQNGMSAFALMMRLGLERIREKIADVRGENEPVNRLRRGRPSWRIAGRLI